MRSLTVFALWVVAASLASAGQRPTVSVHRLLELLRDRILTGYAVAEAKHNSGAPVEDRKREAAVVAAAAAAGNRLSIPAERTRALFTAQIEANKVVQRELLAKWSGRPKFDHVPDLAQVIRPKLDALTHRILSAYLDSRSVLSRPGAHRIVLSEARTITFSGPDAPIYRTAWAVALHGLLAGLK